MGVWPRFPSRRRAGGLFSDLAFAWDEGFHLLAAQLIGAGKRPYLDFCFPQTPLNAYWNALWMAVFGESWRTAHAVATVATAGSCSADSRLPRRAFRRPGWRLAVALTAALTVGLNQIVLYFGTISPGLRAPSVLISSPRFAFPIETVDRKGLLLPVGWVSRRSRRGVLSPDCPVERCCFFGC